LGDQVPSAAVCEIFSTPNLIALPFYKGTLIASEISRLNYLASKPPFECSSAGKRASFVILNDGRTDLTHPILPVGGQAGT